MRRRNVLWFAVVCCCCTPLKSDDRIEWVSEQQNLTALPVLELPVPGARAVTALRDGQLVVWAPGELSVWDARGTQRWYAIPTGDVVISSLSVAPNQREIWGLSQAGDLHRWELPAAKRGWGPEQALGPPDTRTMGDQSTAWASATQDDQPEWLLLDYAQPVAAREIVIYETLNPGALTKVSLLTDSTSTTLWEGKDPYAMIDGVAVATIPVTIAEPIQRIRLDFQSNAVAGWNEIDAVGVRDADGQLHWATRAACSSTFGSHIGVSSPHVAARRNEPPPAFPLPQGTTLLKHDDGAAEGKQSYGGTGFAVAFEADSAGRMLAGVEIFGSRYGTSAPPAENFTVTILDQDRTVIAAREFPYAAIERGPERWYPLALDPIRVPADFFVAIDFHAHQTKGVYIGKDTNGQTDSSYIGTVEKGFRVADPPGCWMIRAHLAAPTP